MERVTKFSLDGQEKGFSRLIEGKDLIDLSFANQMADHLRAWSQNQGITHFCYWAHPFFEWHSQRLELKMLTGASLNKRDVNDSFSIAFDPTSSPFIYQDKLWIPSLVFSLDGHVRDYKVPLLRALIKMKQEIDINPKIQIKFIFYLIEKEIVMRSQDLFQLGKKVYGKGLGINEGECTERFLKEVIDEARNIGIKGSFIKRSSDPSKYEMLLPKQDVSFAIDQAALVLEIMEKIGKVQKIVPLFSEMSLDIKWFPGDLEIFDLAFYHAMHANEDLIYTFCMEGNLHFKDGLILQRFNSLANLALGLCAIFAAIADSLQLICRDNGKDRFSIKVSKEMPEIKKTKTFSQVYAPFSDQKAVRCFSNILSVQELDFFHKMYLNCYVSNKSKEIAFMIKEFREQILPLKNKSEQASFALKQSIIAIDNLDQFRENIDDLGLEAKGKAIFEIGIAKMQQARDLVNQLFIDF